MAKTGKPYIANIEPFVAAGIDPKTGLPTKFSFGDDTTKADIKKILRVIDEQDAVNRYVWYNLPCNITGQELERMLYYKGQLAFFFIPDLNQFYFMPYALDGTIDFYGRYNSIHPVPMTGGTAAENKAQTQYLSQIKLKCVYGFPDQIDADTVTKSAVLLYDYSKQLSQTTVARQQLNEPLLDVMSECIPYMRTALINGTGVKGVRVNDADQQAQVEAGSRTVRKAALTSNPWVSFIGNIEMQDLTDGGVAQADQYMMALQSLDNFRMSTYGIDKGGVYQKNAYQNNQEVSMNATGMNSPYTDGLTIRQNFCAIVNSIWNLGIWCEPSESQIAQDTNGDGVLGPNNASDVGQHQSSSSSSSQNGGTNND